MFKYIKKLLFPLIITVSLLAGIFIYSSDIAEAEIGQTTVSIDCFDIATGDIRHIDNAGKLWAAIRGASAGTEIQQLGLEPEISADDANDKWDKLQRGVVSFDLESAGIESLENVDSVTLYLKLQNKYNDFTNGNSPSCSIYNMSMPPANGYGGTLSVDDYNNLLGGKRVTNEIMGYDEYKNGDTIAFPITKSDWEDCLFVEDGYAYFSVLLTHDAMNVSPVWQNQKSMGYVFYASAGPSGPKLEVVILGELPDRVITVYENDDIDTEILGDELLDIIYWGSPRAAYNDEDMMFVLSGDSGAPLNMELRDSNNKLLASHIDSIRINDFYYYGIELNSTMTGFVRLVEKNFNLYSEWGYISPAPDSTQNSPYTYAKFTSYPQYNIEFGNYVVHAGDYLVYHWQTRLDEYELSLASARIWYLCNSNQELFNKKLSDLNNEYFKPIASENEYLAAWRFIVIALNSGGSGWKDYDGMAINLSRTYELQTQGFYTMSIYEDGIEEYAVPHSAFWYLTSATIDGIVISMDKSKYDPGEDINVTLSVGSASKVITDLSYCIVRIMGENDAIYYTVSQEITVKQTTFNFPAPLTEGAYKIRISLGKDGKSYQYIKDTAFSVGPDIPVTPTATGIVGKIENLLGGWGLDSPAGRWISLIIGMTILFMLFFASSVLRIVMPSLLFGAACVFGWIDIWYIALLALIDGFLIFSIFNRRIHGGGGASGD